jgi:hypothetical protein
MKLNDYELDSAVLKANENLTLRRCDMASVEINQGTLAVAVRNQDRKEGTYFLGTANCL